MRTAVLVIGLVMFVILLPLSCASMTSAGCVDIGNSILGDSDNGTSSDMGSFGAGIFWVALLSAVGAGFVLQYPVISVIVYSISALFALGLPNWSAPYRALAIPMVGLAIMSYFGYRELKKKEPKNLKTGIIKPVESPETKSQLPDDQLKSTGFCTSCSAPYSKNDKFCGKCGAKLD